MKYLNQEKVSSLLPYDELINALKIGFKQGGVVPLRHSHTVTTSNGIENSMLLMPCWQIGGMMGLKTVMVCPDNHLKNLESIQASYLLSDATTGELKAILDGDELTVRRTACASALASSYLSNPDATSMLMMGAGKLAPYLIRAHCTVRNFENIYIWARREEQAEILAANLNKELSANVIAISDSAEQANMCDVISCATMASEPILKGQWLNKNKHQHIDLVGGYTYGMREADNAVVASADIYVDTFDGALAEAGDILRPINEGIISKSDIKGDLYDMVKDGFQNTGSKNKTLFKSVGTALEDLIAAKLVYQKSE